MHDHSRPWELYFAITSGITYFAGLAAQYVFGAPEAVYLSLYFATYFFGGFFTIREAYESIRRGRFEVDFLMIVAAIGAAAVGKFSEGAVLLFLFSLGHALEEFALARATRSIEALAALAPRTAILLRDGEQVEVPVEELQPGDVALVRPHARIPADGLILEGNAAVDQSAVTGESIPVDKTEGDRVYAGTVNGATAFTMTVTAAAQDSMLTRVIALVEDADTTSSPTARFIDRFQLVYVPAVIALVVVVLLVGLFALHEPFDQAFYRSMLVLVAASPCALAIATPSAVLAAIARAARAGVLIKGGAPLEMLGKVNVIAFDKTGTLTWGQPSIASITGNPEDDGDLQELQAVALAVESQSDHPLAEAITHDLGPLVPEAARLQATDLQAVPGQGVTAQVAGQEVRIGNAALMGAMPAWVGQAITQAEDAGQTTMIVRMGAQYLGVIGVMDQPRLEAPGTMQMLREGGVDDLVLLSGDNQQVASAVGASVGVDRAVGGLLPEGKVEHIRDLDGVVAVVGDGVNDAPAMANAAVGIAMGAAGSTVALEAADIALMGDDLGKIPFIRRLSRATTRTIQQNLFISMAIVAFLVPASLLGMAMGPVVLIHEGSTILVIFNALRLLRFQADRDHHGIEHEDRPARPGTTVGQATS